MHQSIEPSADGGNAAESRGQTAVPGVSDADLMRKLRRPERDIVAFEAFYDRRHRHALALATRLSHDPAQVEQAVEDAFLLVWRMADRYEPAHSSPQAWLLGIVAWRCRALNRAPAGVRPHLLVDRAPAGATYREPLDGRHRERGWLTHELESKTLS